MTRTLVATAIALGFIIVVLLLPAVEQKWHLPLSPPDQLGAISAVVAAIFTAGGLIIGLVSLFTLYNVDRVVDRAVIKAVDDAVVKNSTNFQTLMHATFDAYTKFRYAETVWVQQRFPALPLIESLLEDADRLNPPLEQITSWGGRLLFLAGRAIYLNDQIGPLPGEPSPVPMRSQVPALILQALPRLRHSLQTSSNEEERSAFALKIAQAHALLGDSPNRVVQALKAGKTDAGYPNLEPVTAITLLSSCQSVADALRVLNAYGFVLPSAEEILSYLKAQPVAMQRQRFVAFPRDARAIQDVKEGPLAAIAVTTDHWGTGRIEWRASIQNYIVTLGGLPEFTTMNDQGQQATPEPEETRELIRRALELLIVIVPMNWEYWAWE